MDNCSLPVISSENDKPVGAIEDKRRFERRQTAWQIRNDPEMNFIQKSNLSNNENLTEIFNRIFLMRVIRKRLNWMSLSCVAKANDRSSACTTALRRDRLQCWTSIEESSPVDITVGERISFRWMGGSFTGTKERKKTRRWRQAAEKPSWEVDRATHQAIVVTYSVGRISNSFRNNHVCILILRVTSMWSRKNTWNRLKNKALIDKPYRLCPMTGERWPSAQFQITVPTLTWMLPRFSIRKRPVWSSSSFVSAVMWILFATIMQTPAVDAEIFSDVHWPSPLDSMRDLKSSSLVSFMCKRSMRLTRYWPYHRTGST